MQPLQRILPSGDNDGGRGWQCSKYSAYLATGQREYSSSHPDWGPVNGKQMVNWLVAYHGYVRCGYEDGAIFSMNIGENGHTGIVLSASAHTVNNANYSNPLLVSNNTINLSKPSYGATFCKLPGAVVTAPAPVTTNHTTPVVKSAPVASTTPKKAAVLPTVSYTLAGIALAAGITLVALQQANPTINVDPNKPLTPDQTKKIVIPEPNNPKTGQPQTQQDVAIQRCELIYSDCDVQVVTSYDSYTGQGTLWYIAQQTTGNGQNWTQLMQFNKENVVQNAVQHNLPADGHWIFPGQQIVAPVVGASLK